MLPFRSIKHKASICFHCFADDTQLYFWNLFNILVNLQFLETEKDQAKRNNHTLHLTRTLPFLSLIAYYTHLTDFNDLFTGLPKNPTKQLQLVQNTATQIPLVGFEGAAHQKDWCVLFSSINWSKTKAHGDAAISFQVSRLQNSLHVGLKICTS